MDSCRGCLEAAPEAVSLWVADSRESPPLAEMLAACAGITVAKGDGFPEALCRACAHALPEAWKFVQTCRAADRRLRGAQLDVKEEYECASDTSTGAPEEPLFCEIPPLETVSERKETKNRRRKVPKPKRNSFSCSSCNHVAETVNDFRKHLKNEHIHLLQDIKHPCSICAKKFKRKSDLVVHLRIHSGEKPFACDYCPMRFTQSGTLIEHKRNHTGEMPFSCTVCPKVFSSRSSFWRHRRVHTKERPYACELCGKSFSHSSTLKHHRLVHSDERPHACEVCGKTAKSKYALQQHMTVHSEKVYVCEQCGKKFSMKANLVNHIKKMHSEGAGQCRFCKKETSNLEEHMLIHSCVALYRCHICDRAFKQKNSLSFHIALHINAEKYKCEMEGCKKAFPKRNMLDFHIRKIHSNETPHICQYCSKGYFRISDLSRHLNTLHPDENRGPFKAIKSYLN